MPVVIVTCPTRGHHAGFYSVAGFFGVGDTRAELTAEQLAALKGEIERKESVLSVRELTPKELAAEAEAKKKSEEEAALEAELAAEAEAKKKGKK